MKKVLLILVAFAIVAGLVSLKVRRRTPDPETPVGSWEPASGPTTS